jgi:SAM-dependent methyltransferase
MNRAPDARSSRRSLATARRGGGGRSSSANSGPGNRARLRSADAAPSLPAMPAAVVDRVSCADPIAALRTRARGYGNLPWVNDRDWFSALLPEEAIAGAQGVLDLGCGPARLAPWLRHRADIPYVGVERDPQMLRQARDPWPCSASLLRGDLETLYLPRFENWTFVVANVLHYLRDLQSLASLHHRFGKPYLICLAQTESADENSLNWARELFAIVRPGYRRLWHKAGDLDRCLEEMGAKVTFDGVVHQSVDLESWLDGWQICEGTRRRALEHFDQGPSVARDDFHERVMVRRQRIVHFQI